MKIFVRILKCIELGPRSSLDDYCPPEQVDSIQQGVVSALEEKIEEELIEMHFNYCAQDDE